MRCSTNEKTSHGTSSVDGQFFMDNISTIITCNYIVVVAYHRRRPGLSNAPLNMKYDNHGIER